VTSSAQESRRRWDCGGAAHVNGLTRAAESLCLCRRVAADGPRARYPAECIFMCILTSFGWHKQVPACPINVGQAFLYHNRFSKQSGGIFPWNSRFRKNASFPAFSPPAISRWAITSARCATSAFFRMNTIAFIPSSTCTL